MSCVGTATGAPLEGDRMLLAESISTSVCICASMESGTCTAIWSPSKSALNAVQTRGWISMALPSTRMGSKPWMPSRCSVGARFSSTGCSWMTSSRMSHTSGRSFSTYFFAALIDEGMPRSSSLRWIEGLRGDAALLQLAEDERLEELERHLLGQAALVQLEVRADHDDRAPGVVHALAEQALTETALLAAESGGEQ